MDESTHSDHRLRLEFEILSRLRHPNLAGLRMLDRAASGPSRFALEPIDGATIEEAVRREGASLLLDLVAETLRALALLHDSGLVHGGLEPGNLLVRREPRLGCRVALVEFALALREESGTAPTVTGPWIYRAPELLDDPGATDPRSDLYALGAVIFRTVHGRPPFKPRGNDVEALAAAVRAGRRTRPALPAGYPAGLHELIDDLLAPEPASRPASARSALDRMNELCATDYPAETVAGRSARLTSAAPAGREPEYRQIRDLLGSSQGSGVIWLCGEAGSGKQRLMRLLAGHAATLGFRVDGVGALVQRWRGRDTPAPLLVLLDEAGGGGEGTVELARRVALDRSEPPVRLVASLVPSLVRSAELKRLLDLSGTMPTIHRIDLEPLDLDRLSALVTRATGDRETARTRIKRLHRASGGHLAAAEALVVAGDEPGGILDMLSPSATDVLRALAIGGNESEEERVATVADVEPGAVTAAVWELSAAGLIHGLDRSWTIDSPAVARLALERMDAGRRRSMSAREAAAAGDGSADLLSIEQAGALAAKCGDLRIETRAGAAAARDAFLRGRFAEAVRAGVEHERRALLLGDEESYRICRASRGRALAACGRAPEAVRLLEETLDAASDTGSVGLDPVRLALIEARLGGPHTDHDSPWELLEGPLARARAGGNGDELPWALALEAQRLARLKGADALDSLRRELEGKQLHGSMVELARGGALLASGRFAEAAEAARAAAELARQIDLPARGARAYAILVEALEEQGLREAADRAREHGRSLLQQAAVLVDDPDLRRGFEEQRGLAALEEPASITGAAANLRLLALYRMIRAVNSEADPEQLLESILDMALRVVQAERGMILLRDAETGAFAVRLARGVERETEEDAEAFSRHIVAEAGAGKPVLALDARRDDRFRELKSVSLYGIHSLMCVPLRSRGAIIGTVYLDNRRSGRLFTPEDLRFVEAFADHAALALENANTRTELQRDNLRLQAEAESVVRFGNLVGRSPGMLQVFDLIDKVAASELTVLIQGESGTGKELVARAIHFGGARKKRAFISENCAALPDSLLQSELFGHVRGAFTGADRNRIGMFEQADGGTLFLDEIGDMSASMQAQILRLLQEGEVRRVGGDHSIHVDVRLIAATHRDLRREVAAGRFREDLMYRLQVMVIPLPPLRERPGDVRLLVEHFLGRIAAERGRAPAVIDRDVLERMESCSWPGNVRQLENTLQRLTLLAGDGPVTGDVLDLDPGLNRMLDPKARRPASPLSLQQSERERIAQALAAAKGNRTQAARMLGISRATIYRKIKEYRF